MFDVFLNFRAAKKKKMKKSEKNQIITSARAQITDVLLRTYQVVS